MSKGGARLFNIEHPANGGVLVVTSSLPDSDFALERVHVGDAPFEALVNQHRQLNLDHVEPGSVFGREVKLQLAEDAAGFSRRKGDL